MSRLCVKNIPAYVTEQQLRTHFASEGGVLTDVKILKTPEGHSRQMAFLGFSREQDARAAEHHFNGTYMHTCKLQVEAALRVGDEKLPRAWSRHSKRKEAERDEGGGGEESEAEKERRFQQFLAQVKPEAAAKRSGEAEDLQWLASKKKRRTSPDTLQQKEEERVLATGRLFVRNLSYQCSEDQLRALMEEFGEVNECRIALTPDGSSSKGYAFVGYVRPTDALQAFAEVDGSIFQGRLLHVLPSNEEITEDQSGVPGSFREKREAELRETAEQSFNWSTLFVRADTAAAAMANRLGVSKGELLDHTASGSAAVRVALSEAEIVSENKQFLRDNGVSLDAFTARTPERSTTTILCKNLPFTAYKEELQLMFMEHGKVRKVVLTPSNTVALVDFYQPSEASRAFKSLAYRKYHDAPLYLEWAPQDVFDSNAEPASTLNERAEDEEEEEDVVLEEDEEEEEEEDKSIRSLFVKNLNFRTTEDQMAALFNTVGTVVSATVVRKKDSGQSLGYGFVEFAEHSHAIKAIKKLQSRLLDNHALELSLSKPRGASAAPQAKKRKTKKFGKLSSKLVIRNVPFEASKKELQTLFSAYGQLKSLRLPKKMDGRHRGFCFVEYNSKQEAKTAMEAAGSTHLYGRHLVIEYAKE